MDLKTLIYFKVIFYNIFSKVTIIYGKLYPEIFVCQDSNILLSSENNTVKVIDVVNGASVKLHCSFCSAEINYEPKIWYYKKRGFRYHVEILNGKNLDIKNMSLSSKNVLRITYFNTSVHSGIYTCKVLQTENQSETIFKYVLEGVYDIHDVSPSIGAFNEWIRFKEGILDPINEQFENPNQEPFINFKKLYNFTFRVKTYWEPWGNCEVSSGFEGYRRKIGKCRLKVVPNTKKNKEKIASKPKVDVVNQFYTAERYDVPCRSITLNEQLPSISRVVRYIPDYEARALCVMERRILSRPTWINEYKFTSTIQIPEDGHIVLACPESFLKSKVQWLKDGNLLNNTFKYNIVKNEEEPRLTIDSYNTLFIFHATKKEEGNYSCIVDGRKMYKYDLKVFTKSGLLSDDFYRYSIYLGFVLLLTTTCYCAGICVAWHERASFSDPLNLNKKNNEYQHLQSIDSEQ